MMENTENKILEVYDNQERYWLESIIRLMGRIQQYAQLIQAAIERKDATAAMEHLTMLAALAKDEKESSEKQLETSKEK